MDTVKEVAQRAKNAARELRMLTRDQKDDALRVIAARLKAEKDFISTQTTWTLKQREQWGRQRR